jgi:hypothetical protein
VNKEDRRVSAMAFLGNQKGSWTKARLAMEVWPLGCR